jgi:hypothetical protein
MNAILGWIKGNPYKFAVIILSLAVILSGVFGYGCGYIKGCNKSKEVQEEVKK